MSVKMRSDEEVIDRICILVTAISQMSMDEPDDPCTPFWKGRIKVYTQAVSVLLWVLGKQEHFTLV